MMRFAARVESLALRGKVAPNSARCARRCAFAGRWLVIFTLVISFNLRADVILDWNALALECIRNENTSPALSARNLAILHTAMYDAVNSITRTHRPYRLAFNTSSNASPEAAAVAAAHQVLRHLYPSLAVRADQLRESWNKSTKQDTAFTNGWNLGREIGLRALDARASDGSNTEVPYIPSRAPGQWLRTPPLFRPPLTPQLGRVQRFCLTNLVSFLPGPPPALQTPEYAAALNEVKATGGKTSSLRTAEQSQIAVFWSDFSYTAMPPGHWHEIAATLGRSRTNSLADNARLFALLSLAQADAAMVCWEAKYRYNTWRPVTAIRRADEDGNEKTDQDAEWESYLASPPFPAYTSGHSTFSKASASVLAHFFGTDTITFTVTSDSLPSVTRTFHSLSACADEIGLSRIYGGIHYSFDNDAGKACGQKIGDYISANFLQPANQLSPARSSAFPN